MEFFCRQFVIVIHTILIFGLMSTCSSQGQGNQNQSSLSSSVSNIISTPAFSHLNQSIKQDLLKNDFKLSNNTHERLEKVFGVDRSVFEEYFKDEDLTIIPGIREDDDLDNWIPPPELPRDFPIYLSGFDNEGRPIWVYEWGKWRFDKYVTGDRKKAALFDKYMRYFTYTIIKSQALRSTKEHRVIDNMSILDYGGFQPASVLNRKVLQLQVKVFSNYRRFAEKYVAKCIAINVNPIVEVFLNFVRPFFNRLLDRFEVYGTNKYIWGPQLLKYFPKDQIPEWYGGNKGFVPFLRFGSTQTSV